MDRNARPCENTSRFFEGRAIVERIVGDERNEPRRLIFRDRLEKGSCSQISRVPISAPQRRSLHPFGFLLVLRVVPRNSSTEVGNKEEMRRRSEEGGRTRKRERERREIRNNLTLQFYGPTSGRGGP